MPTNKRVSMKTTRLAGLLLALLIGPVLVHAQVATAPATQPSKPNLAAGAAWEYSTDGGKTFTDKPPIVEPAAKLDAMARCTFKLGGVSQFVILELNSEKLSAGLSWKLDYTVNGKAVKPPLPRMIYRDLPIDPALFKAGDNTIEVRCTSSTNTTVKTISFDLSPVRLTGLAAGDLKVLAGPILGAFDDDSFTVTCLTNMPADVRVQGIQGAIGPPDGPPHVFRTSVLGSSSGAYVHRFHVKRLQTRPRSYHLIVRGAKDQEQELPLGDPPPVAKDRLRFIITGDNRSITADWVKIIAAIQAAKPQFIVHTGDLAGLGLWQHNVLAEFFQPAKELLATTPIYWVRGNHEVDSPIYDELMPVPGGDDKDGWGKAHNWSQRIGPMLLVGVDGLEDFKPGSKNAKWLDKTLADGKDAKFIFFVNHYPPYGSSAHDRLAADGLPGSAGPHTARVDILPLLAKYKVTAFFCGHDHVYERSAPPEGVPIIITGGAGGPYNGPPKFAPSKQADKPTPLAITQPTNPGQNPHAKVFSAQKHYCLMEIEGDTCKMTVLTLDGRTIDSVTFNARR